MHLCHSHSCTFEIATKIIYSRSYGLFYINSELYTLKFGNMFCKRIFAAARVIYIKSCGVTNSPRWYERETKSDWIQNDERSTAMRSSIHVIAFSVESNTEYCYFCRIVSHKNHIDEREMLAACAHLPKMPIYVK